MRRWLIAVQLTVGIVSLLILILARVVRLTSPFASVALALQFAAIPLLVCALFITRGPDRRVDIGAAFAELPPAARSVLLALGLVFAVAAALGFSSGPHSKSEIVTDGHGSYWFIVNDVRYSATKSEYDARINHDINWSAGIAGFLSVAGLSLTWKPDRW